MKFFCFLLFTVFLLFSCSREVKVIDEKPDNLIEREKMIEILTELSIVESIYQMKYVQVSRYESLLSEKADSIFNKFGVDKVIFDENMNYYLTDQEDMALIYGKVKENITSRLNELPKDDDSDDKNKERQVIEIREDESPILPMRSEEDMYKINQSSN